MGRDKAYEEWLWERIKEQIPKISKREARFRQVDKIPALGAFMKTYESNCSECKLYRKEIERVVENLPKVLKYKGPELEREIEAWKEHLKEKHGVFPDLYFNYRYSSYSFFAGLVVGAVLSYLFYDTVLLSSVGLTASAFLIAGVIYGSRLDAKVKKEGKNY
ncbi:hypothetical protein C7377_0135 [Balneicella halophila]|uniref:Uncharacterized protein n=1 Tax=Balneicella halophila TaxID=1537566 RepID=A0A7L4UPY7_BALHA|nr:hypothetical protein [Balneicella halophila]PVX51845.1 hypothetical protein C7377_0135 [Balneicella halophila]